jgi:hypothetical protein
MLAMYAKGKSRRQKAEGKRQKRLSAAIWQFSSFPWRFLNPAQIL